MQTENINENEQDLRTDNNTESLERERLLGMRKEIQELIGKWDHFRDVRVATNSYALDENDVNTYKSLMSESFRLLKAEWVEEKINKDIALLFATIGFFSAKTADDDGNVLGNEEYDRITTLNMFFVNELLCIT